jgi:hypothetical protein
LIHYSPDKIGQIAERVSEDFGAFAFDGFGIMLTDEQLEARQLIGPPGPRRVREYKHNWLSGGQRAGKTVLAFLFHAEACLYKIGVDVTDERFWTNYQYGTLAIAPTTDLTLRLWTIGDEIQKGSNDAQFDRRARRARGGAFLSLFRAGTERQWPIIRFTNGSHIDFRSSEGWAVRLEGGQWWFITWDEWASQADREIKYVLSDVLYGRARDHDAKLMPMAWPKPETERHLISVIRAIEKGADHDSQVIYLSAEQAAFTNRTALETERRIKSPADWKRTVLGRPAGGASVEFKSHMTERLFRPELPKQSLREDGYRYLSAWDIGLAHDSTEGFTFRIPLVDGRPVVTINEATVLKARIVHHVSVPGGDDLTVDRIAFEIMREQQTYNSLTVLDATSMGGLMAFRQVKAMRPGPLAFVSRSNDRIHGNMRLAAITNALDLLAWGRTDELTALHGDNGYEWGLIESPYIVELADQLANFDRDAKSEVPDDVAWAFIIGCWYLRRLFVVENTAVHVQRSFDPRMRGDGRGRGRLIRPRDVEPAVGQGLRLIQPRR